MSTSNIVDQKYRLAPADLRTRSQRAVIVNVSYQGLEDLKAVAHFDGPVKPMVLSPSQVRDLVRITDTAIFSDRIGHALILTLPRNVGESEIELLSDSAQDPQRSSPVFSNHVDLTEWLVAILIVLGLVILSLAYVQQNGQSLWDTILALFE